MTTINQLAHDKIVKILENTLPDSMSENQESAVYSTFDPDYVIINNYDTDEFVIQRKVDNNVLNEIGIANWIKEKLGNSLENTLEHIKSGNGVQSLNFVQNLGFDPRKLPKIIKLSLEKTKEICNAVMQEMHPLIDKLSDEEMLEELCKRRAQVDYLEKHLTSKGIRIKEAASKRLNDEYETNKAGRTLKGLAGKTDKADKPKLTEEQKRMKIMGRDYNNPVEVEEYRAFIKSLGAQ